MIEPPLLYPCLQPGELENGEYVGHDGKVKSAWGHDVEHIWPVLPQSWRNHSPGFLAQAVLLVLQEVSRHNTA